MSLPYMQHQVPHDDYGMYHQTPPLTHLNFPSGTKHVEERQHMRSRGFSANSDGKSERCNETPNSVKCCASFSYLPDKRE